MKIVHIFTVGLLLTCTSCLNFNVEMPIGDALLSTETSHTQMKRVLLDYLPTLTEDLCSQSMLAFLFGTNTSVDLNLAMPEKIRSDVINGNEYGLNLGCPDADAREFISNKVKMTANLYRILAVQPDDSPLNDCQKKFSDPDKVSIESLWLTASHNSLNFDLPAGTIYYGAAGFIAQPLTNLGIAQLVSQGKLVKFASFSGLARGTSKNSEILIDEAQKKEVTKKFLAREITIVIATDDLSFTQISDGNHSYFELPTGEVIFNISANVLTTVGFSDLSCIGQLPKAKQVPA